MDVEIDERRNPAVARSEPKIVIFRQPYRSVKALATGPKKINLQII